MTGSSDSLQIDIITETVGTSPCRSGKLCKVSSILRKAIPNLDLRELLITYPVVTRNYYSALETSGTSLLTPTINSPNFMTLLLEHILSYILFRDSARSRLSSHKTHGHDSSVSYT